MSQRGTLARLFGALILVLVAYESFRVSSTIFSALEWLDSGEARGRQPLNEGQAVIQRGSATTTIEDGQPIKASEIPQLSDARTRDDRRTFSDVATPMVSSAFIREDPVETPGDGEKKFKPLDSLKPHADGTNAFIGDRIKQPLQKTDWPILLDGVGFESNAAVSDKGKTQDDEPQATRGENQDGRVDKKEPKTMVEEGGAAGKQGKSAGEESSVETNEDEFLRVTLKERLVAETLSISRPEALQLLSKIWTHEWTSLGWIANRSVLKAAADRQARFLLNPKDFRPQPVLYRPILRGQGWGNLIYDLAQHVAFALMMERPFLMMLNKKDQHGKLGWNASVSDEDAVLQWRLFDWRWGGKPELLALYNTSWISQPDKDTHVLLSCRQGYALCGANSSYPSFDTALPYLRSVPDKPLYSEFSASFNRPLRASEEYMTWMDKNVVKVGRKNTKGSFMATLLRFAFNVLFKVNPGFYEHQVFPHLKRLTNDFSRTFVTVHVRTGHLENGIERSASNDDDERALMDCQAQDKTNRTWLVLSDNAELALRTANWSYITTDSRFSLQKFHVGHSRSDLQAQAWEVSLRDWLLVVESTGPLMRRSRLSTAFSFSQRGAYIAWMLCHQAKNMTTCGNQFFDEVCTPDTSQLRL